MPEDLPDDVCRLLLEDIEGYEQLEILLLLRAHPTEDWTRDKVAERLHIDPPTIVTALAYLAARNLLEARPGTAYRFAPKTRPLSEAVTKLAQAYDDERRLQVMRVMNQSAMQRLRHGAARVFADAFVFGKESGRDKKDG
jgi:hypothetical protein